MKNLKITTLLTLALTGLLLVLPSTASTSAQLPSGSFSIAFTGFCDGMDLTRTGPVSLAGTLSGCYLGDGIAAGTIAFNYQIVPFVSTPWVGAVVTSNNDQADLSCRDLSCRCGRGLRSPVSGTSICCGHPAHA
jgi:hypothetical protein